MQNLWLRTVRAAIFLSALVFIPAVRAEDNGEQVTVTWIIPTFEIDLKSN